MVRVFAAGDTSFTSNGDAVLRPLRAVVRNELNGDFSLELVCSLSDKEYVQGNNIVVVDLPTGAQAFRIQKPELTGQKITASCRHISFDTDNYLIVASKLENYTALAALVALNAAATPSSPFTLYTDINTTASYEIEKKPLTDAITAVHEAIGGDLVRDNFALSILGNFYTDRGANISYQMGVKEITVSYDWSDVVTKLLPTGADGTMLNSKTPSASIYVESDTQYANPFCKTVSFDQNHIDREAYGGDDGAYTTALIADLQSQAAAYVESHCIPAVNYTIRGLYVDGIKDLGDVVHVMDARLGVDIAARLIAYEYDCIHERFTELQFGDTKKKLSDIGKEPAYTTPTASMSAYAAGDTIDLAGRTASSKATSKRKFAFSLTVPKSMLFVTPTLTALNIDVENASGTSRLSSFDALSITTLTKTNDITLQFDCTTTSDKFTNKEVLTVTINSGTVTFT